MTPSALLKSWEALKRAQDAFAKEFQAFFHDASLAAQFKALDAVRAAFGRELGAISQKARAPAPARRAGKPSQNDAVADEAHRVLAKGGPMPVPTIKTAMQYKGSTYQLGQIMRARRDRFRRRPDRRWSAK